jgi:long-subunit fatty acid transport protein
MLPVLVMRPLGPTAYVRLAALVLAALCPAARAGAATPVPTPNFEDEFAYPNVRFTLATGSGARALGMGGAFIARPDDATAATWNPAGLSYLRAPEISAAGLKSSVAFSAVNADDPTQSNDDRLHAVSPDFLAAAYPVSFGDITGAAQLSFQRVIPFGGNREITRGTAGAQVQLESTGGFDVFAAGLGVQVSRKLRIGGTLNKWTNGYGVSAQRNVVRPATRKSRLDLSGFNFNLGVIVSPWEDLNIGVMGKTPFTGDVTLDRSRVDFPVSSTGSTTQLAGVGTTSTTNQAFADNLRLHFPGAVGVGASWRATPALTVSLDVTRTFWSHSSIENFFEIPPQGDPQVFPSLPFPTLRVIEQTDTQQVRAGLEYVVIGSRLKWPFRIGYINDRQYFQAVDGPPHFNALTLGTGVVAGHLLLDIAYVYERGHYTELSDVPGAIGPQVETTSHRFYGSIIFRFSE